MKYFEGVPWYRHRVTFKLTDGRRLVRHMHSPGAPWVYSEVARSLENEFGFSAEPCGPPKVVPGSVRVESVDPCDPARYAKKGERRGAA